MSRKIATLINPFYIKQVDRKHVTSVLESILCMGGSIRSNGNGGKNGVLSNLHTEGKDDKVFYLSKDNFYSLERDPRLVVTDKQQTEADIILTGAIPRFTSCNEDEKNMLRATLFSIYGQNLNNKSDVILIVRRSFNSSTHKVDHWLYVQAIKLARKSGIKTININPRVMENSNETSSIPSETGDQTT